MHTFSHAAAQLPPQARTRGWVMDMGWRYDAMVAVLNAVVFRGKLRGMLHRAIELAELLPGERVLDVGCGTGTLALLAREAVGETGTVAGIDPGPRQIERARAKAARKRRPVDFRVGVVERLPFADRSMDVVFSTLMMHHLPDDLKRQGIAEIGRVLVRGGRVVVVDFARPERAKGGFGAGALGIQDLPGLLRDAGFRDVRSGGIPVPRLMGMHGAGFVVAAAGG